MALYGDLTYDSRVRKEARTLANAGFDITIVCLAAGDDRSDLPAGVKVLVLRPPGDAVLPGSSNAFSAAPAGRIRALRARAGWLRGYVRGLRAWGRLAVAAVTDVDVWHAHDLTGLAAISPSLGDGVPVVYDSHELFLEQGVALRLPGPARRLLRAYERRLVARTAAVITVNDEIAGVLRHRYHPAAIAVVHNCPDRWTPPAQRPGLLREAAGIPPTSQVLLYHGALIAGRGVEGLMEALLAPDLEDVHLVLMGYGDRRDALLDAARSGPWRDRLHVLDPVPPSELLPWVAGADAGAMLNPGMTLNDQFSAPNKLFECIAAGTPVVASDLPTMRRIITGSPGRPLGAVCDPARAESIADAIRSIVRLEPGAREAMRTACLRAAAERWNWDAEGRALLSVYAAVAPER